MVAKRLQLDNGYSFCIFYRGRRWFANRVYPNIPQVQAAMLEIMKAGNISACPILAIGQDVVYSSQEVL